ncbi:pectate lyase [Daejeonella sp.]|jgi:PelA/Pel-15E family pectate lyase|uniref:pectate lyase n=1 Tax=Daejeonella sp. TaxID=2805397 RepID=UPI0037C16631
MVTFKSIVGSVSLSLLLALNSFAQPKNLNEDVRSAMLRATQFMVEKASTNGGYVAHYLPDFSRRWGELEGYQTQIWVQDPGTVSMGNIFLDAYKATGDEYYYQAAKKVAAALIWGQRPEGGWNYMIDFAGDRSLKQWYNTIGKNAWGFEEYYYYYNNTTFDDSNTSGPANFLLRIYLQKLDITYKPALDKAIQLIIDSQYPLGGWPQRYPLKNNHPKNGKEDYTSFYTFNDEVISGNIDFLIQCYATLGEERFLDPIRRGMNFYLITQQGNPQAGWGQQYNMELEPTYARSYEPASLMPGFTYTNTLLLLKYYQLTGDRKFLARIPDAIKWLESTVLPPDKSEGGTRTHATFIEIGTNKGLYAHRKGNGVSEGHYWVDYDDKNLLAHYGGKATINIQFLKDEYKRVSSLAADEAVKNSPLKVSKVEGLPQQQLLIGSAIGTIPNESVINSVIKSLDQDRWLVKHIQISRPYSISADGKEMNTAKLSDENGKGIVDATEQLYISTREYEKNMSLLIKYLSR